MPVIAQKATCRFSSNTDTVKSINGNKITIEFKDFNFERYTSFDSNNKQKITINGTITFTLDD